MITSHQIFYGILPVVFYNTYVRIPIESSQKYLQYVRIYARYVIRMYVSIVLNQVKSTFSVYNYQGANFQTRSCRGRVV